VNVSVRVKSELSSYCLLLHTFICGTCLTTFQKDEVFLNLVLEYVPENLYRVARHYSKNKQTIPMLYIKVCMEAP